MRALISVYDKEGIVEFAKELVNRGWEIISTGGTYKKLKDAGIDVISVDKVTGFPEILDGRVKTLNPKIHAGILARRDLNEHMETLKEEEIGTIDMVVNNLYPFEEKLLEKADHDTMIENIDIGGPSMIRAAAKNYKDVYIVTDPADYDSVLNYIDKKDPKFNEYLANKAFSYTAHYDAVISNYFAKREGDRFPRYINKSYKLVEELRYGENPHQRAAFYEDSYTPDKIEYKVLHGKQVSYNNLNDMYSALNAVINFDKPAAVAVKHTNPCGIGIGDSLEEAFVKAYECDDESIFGGIIALNREVDIKTAENLSKIFLEIVAAPSFSKEAYDLLAQKKNIRLIEIPDFEKLYEPGFRFKQVLNGIIIQNFDDKIWDEDKLDFVSNREPTEKELEELKFAFTCCKTSFSNSVVIAKDGGTLALGQGETKRSWAVEEAIERAGEKIKGAVLASDGFFFRDTIELLDKAGIDVIVQPGGSVKDQEVIDYANENNICLVFTNMRHFRH
ncbi:bifunctional phosphoribosylaminoimidazolecarboxamide formyltransferase/IMP cyclohydrolase [Peptoniphilus harei]|uniref:Bifunctional purine biosynthesis protein PurH n=1 Tax=Peptoniphilus harei TaxID=54005 RepID=A0A2X1YLM3_9FIRM|nr:bifunctional phosphoribosylaminoimidazolecarboxamide formyltransferase/IMP cyclohydrolase [Peptoniphilus harei]MDU6743945.1 bifunctional phosphoribosylaminoimidazolecarboxamide formyltransferase/IMP cyclohydrolase [Peptoniphilus harei]QQT90787.1 bifunctional phosphoribosylaminoimidazolecarboxamide formyltransferase/IMP cyclohydrolase [Peptoniphilus harei]SPY48401.1 Bifunctional purine biosynthesis protein PurH [Peptoniphilus harei]